MEQPTPQQLREELLLEFDFTAPANWGLPALSKKLAELQGARDALDATTGDTLNQQGDLNEENFTEPAADITPIAAGDTDSQASNTAEAVASNAPIVKSDLPAATNSEPEQYLMVTLLNHEVPGSNPRKVRVRNEHFYTTEPEQYAGVAEVVAELAPEDREAL